MLCFTKIWVESKNANQPVCIIFCRQAIYTLIARISYLSNNFIMLIAGYNIYNVVVVVVYAMSQNM